MACRYCAAPQSFFLRRVRTLNGLLIAVLLAVSVLQYTASWLLTAKRASDELDRNLANNITRKDGALRNVAELTIMVQIVKNMINTGVGNRADLAESNAALAQANVEYQQLVVKSDQQRRQTLK